MGELCAVVAAAGEVVVGEHVPAGALAAAVRVERMEAVAAVEKIGVVGTAGVVIVFVKQTAEAPRAAFAVNDAVAEPMVLEAAVPEMGQLDVH